MIYYFNHSKAQRKNIKHKSGQGVHILSSTFQNTCIDKKNTWNRINAVLSHKGCFQSAKGMLILASEFTTFLFLHHLGPDILGDTIFNTWEYTQLLWNYF